MKRGSAPLGPALLTGASSGIGAALAERLAARGYHVVLAARRLPELEALASRLRSAGHSAEALELDVSRLDETADRVRALDARLGGLELVVANAGVPGTLVRASQQPLEAARRVMDINFHGALATLLPPVSGMLNRGRGKLVGVTSLAARIALPAAADYGTSKAALTFFLESLAADVASGGLQVTIVQPGFVRTAMTARNRFTMPFIMDAEAAATIVDQAIEAGERYCQFPKALHLAASCGRALPHRLRELLLARNSPVR
ncbi:MAG: SDR family NAD(P)-dependent oxidoreductase [Polyangiaceae bacterium]